MPSTQQTVVVTGASSGFGALTVRALADAGHTVYAGMRGTTGRNRAAAAEATEYARASSVDLRPVELDVSSQDSVDAAIARVIAEEGRLDVVVHNAGHMVLGPAEAFTPEQLAAVYDTNVLSTQRVNRAVLPHLRAQRDGLVVWVGSSSTRGGTPPYLAPYFAAKAAEDALAVSYAAELARFGVDTTTVVPGSFTSDHPSGRRRDHHRCARRTSAASRGRLRGRERGVDHGRAALESTTGHAAAARSVIGRRRRAGCWTAGG